MTPRPQLLLAGPSADLVDGLVRLEKAVDRARPLRGKHRASLAGGIAELSGLLTSEREDLPPDYMSRPPHLAAYLRWFLPWNVYRLGRLLPGLPLDLPEEPRVLDLGAGPMTFACALWLARPELRARRLSLLAVDRSDAALKAGRAVFAELAGADAPWRLEGHGRAAGGRMGPSADLLVAVNLLNELEDERGGRRRGPDLEADERLLESWERQVSAGGKVLLVEPGARPASARLVRLRSAALERGWHVASPCPHAAECPLPGRRSGGWCHFACDASGMARWVTTLGARARLPKARVSLSFLLLTREPVPVPSSDTVRIVSGDFDLDGGGRGRYGCTGAGLVVLTGNGTAASGDLIQVHRPDKSVRDARSGAPLVPLPGSSGTSRRRR